MTDVRVPHDPIFRRQSVRRYIDKAVEEEKIDLLLRAAMAAPSAGNQQPWEFYVVTDPGTCMLLGQSSPYAGPAAEAPLVIVPCIRTTGLRFPGITDQDLSAATENILLEAVELGLGAVWMAIHPDEARVAKVREILDIADSLIPFCIIAIGYPGESRPIQDRYDEGRVHRIG